MRSLPILALVLTVHIATAPRSYLAAVEGKSSLQETSDPCQAWNRMVSGLSSKAKETLAGERIVRGHGAYVLSDKLVSDCRLRNEIGRYLQKGIGGLIDNEVDRQFAARHSKEIVGVLRHIWPSLSDAKSWASDGTSHEKYALLVAPGIQAADMLPLVGEILDKEGMDIEMVFVMFYRPAPELKAAVFRQLGKAEAKNDIPAKIYSLALLHRLGERTAASQLKKLSSNAGLSTLEKKLIPSLLAKIKRGETLAYSDVEDLEYKNDRR